MTIPEEGRPKSAKVEQATPPTADRPQASEVPGGTSRTLREALEEVDVTPAVKRSEAAKLPQDVVTMLLEQHARIRELFADVKKADVTHKQQSFDELRSMLAAHEAAEEMVLRPVARLTAGQAEAHARDCEEIAASNMLAELERIDVSDAEFDARLAELERAVLEHAEHEEREEFPAVRAARSEQQLRRLGSVLRLAEKAGPTHPHPEAAGSTTAWWLAGPFASLVDRARDRLHSAGRGI